MVALLVSVSGCGLGASSESDVAASPSTSFEPSSTAAPDETPPNLTVPQVRAAIRATARTPYLTWVWSWGDESGAMWQRAEGEYHREVDLETVEIETTFAGADEDSFIMGAQRWGERVFVTARAEVPEVDMGQCWLEVAGVEFLSDLGLGGLGGPGDPPSVLAPVMEASVVEIVDGGVARASVPAGPLVRMLGSDPSTQLGIDPLDADLSIYLAVEDGLVTSWTVILDNAGAVAGEAEPASTGRDPLLLEVALFPIEAGVPPHGPTEATLIDEQELRERERPCFDW